LSEQWWNKCKAERFVNGDFRERRRETERACVIIEKKVKDWGRVIAVKTVNRGP